MIYYVCIVPGIGAGAAPPGNGAALDGGNGAAEGSDGIAALPVYIYILHDVWISNQYII